MVVGYGVYPSGVQKNFSAVGTLFDADALGYRCFPCYWTTTSYLIDTSSTTYSTSVYGAAYSKWLNTTVSPKSYSHTSWSIDTSNGCNVSDTWTFLGGIVKNISAFETGTTVDSTSNCVWPCIIVGAFGPSSTVWQTTSLNDYNTDNDVNWYFYPDEAMGFTQGNPSTGINVLQYWDQCGFTNTDISGNSVCGNSSNTYWKDYRLSWTMNTLGKYGGGRAGRNYNLYSRSDFYKLAYNCAQIPTSKPTGQPSSQPSSGPTGQPSGLPTGQPSSGPTGQPSGQPTGFPSSSPSAQPSGQPSASPTGQPSNQPTGLPTGQPTSNPTVQPTITITPGSLQTYDQYNHYAFAMIAANGSVIAWGDAKQGGSLAGVSLTNVTEIVGGKSDFYALTSEGAVIAWGARYHDRTPQTLVSSGASSVIPNDHAVAIILDDGSVQAFGHSENGGDISADSDVYTYMNSQFSSGVSVTAVVANSRAFVAIYSDDTIASWGNSYSGGGVTSSSNTALTGIQNVYSNRHSFTALLTDHTLITWGATAYGGSVSVDQSGGGIYKVFATTAAWAAIRHDRGVTTWGMDDYGGNSTSVADLISSDIYTIEATDTAFAALTYSGTVVSWGDSEAGGAYSEGVASLTDISAIYSTGCAFTTLSASGGVYSWGDSNCGGSAPSSLSRVVSIYSTWRAFAALTSYGSVKVWGNTNEGGTLPVGQLNVRFICSNHVAFFLVKYDEASYSWGTDDFGGDSSSLTSSQKSGITACSTQPEQDIADITWVLGNDDCDAVCSSVYASCVQSYAWWPATSSEMNLVAYAGIRASSCASTSSICASSSETSTYGYPYFNETSEECVFSSIAVTEYHDACSEPPLSDTYRFCPCTSSSFCGS